MSVDFDVLLEAEPVQHKAGIAEWEGPVPPSAIKAVEKAIVEGPQVLGKLDKPVSLEGAAMYKSALKAALALVSPGNLLNIRDKYSKDVVDADGTLVQTGGDFYGFSFSVGKPRRNRKSASEALEG